MCQIHYFYFALIACIRAISYPFPIASSLIICSVQLILTFSRAKLSVEKNQIYKYLTLSKILQQSIKDILFL